MQRIKAADLRKLRPKGVKRVKNAKRVTVDVITFDSKREAARWVALQQRVKSGSITNLERQVSFVLKGQHGPILTPTGKPMRSVVDFRYVDWDLGGIWVLEDAKGYQTDVSKIKMAIMAAQGHSVVLS